MSDAEAKEDEKKAPAVKGRKGKKDVIFIGDVYRNLYHMTKMEIRSFQIR